jgi:protein-disulfide isomerase
MAKSRTQTMQFGLVSIGALLILARLPCMAATQPPEPGYLGAAKPDVTILEYFDYNCPYCRRLAPVLRALLVQDRRVAVVYKEWPIFGGISVYAARSALAAQWQGKYIVAHDALSSGPELTKNQDVDEALARVGIDVARLRKDETRHAVDIEASLERNDAEAHSLNLRGTPGVVVLGGKVLPGDIGLEGLRQSIAEFRR